MDTQQIITLMIVAVAAFYVIRRLWRAITNRDGGHCAGCGECGKPARPGDLRSAPKATPLITLSAGSDRPRFRPPQPGA